MKITTIEEYDAAQREWEGCEYALGGGCLSPEESRRAWDKQIEIERAMDDAPFDFDEDGNPVPKSPSTPPTATPAGGTGERA